MRRAAPWYGRPVLRLRQATLARFDSFLHDLALPATARIVRQ